MAREMDEVRTVEVFIDELLGDSVEFHQAVETAGFALEGAALITRMRSRADGGTGITKAELARRLRISAARVNAMEKGAGSQGPTYAMLKRVAIACGLDFDGARALVGDEKAQGTSSVPHTTDRAVTAVRDMMTPDELLVARLAEAATERAIDNRKLLSQKLLGASSMGKAAGMAQISPSGRLDDSFHEALRNFQRAYREFVAKDQNYMMDIANTPLSNTKSTKSKKRTA